MKKLLFLIAIVTVQCLFSQIKFEKGYFINNNDEKTECLIKNEDWNYNPKFISYKASDNDNVAHQNSISDIKEFGIYNQSKYIRYDVQIDRSSDQLSKLTTEKNPVFKTETLLLKLLVEGDENLYVYSDSNIKRFFFGKTNELPKQLVYIVYSKPDESKVVYNNEFQSQIEKNLTCSSLSKMQIQRVKYNQSSLTDVFSKYNTCRNPAYVIAKNDKKNFHLNVRPFVSSSALNVEYNGGSQYDVDFGNKMSFSLGLEAEYILPFNKNKWSIIVEPQYQYFKADKTVETTFASGNYLNAAIDFKSIAVPIGIRHYMFLTEKSKVFINASYAFNLTLGNNLTYYRIDGLKINELKLKTNGNFVIGAGYKYDKYSVEVRANLKKSVISTYSMWSSSLTSYNLIFGYTLF